MDTLEATITVLDLEQLVNGDDCKCEAKHDVVTLPCSFKVVALKTTCRLRFRICENSLKLNMTWIQQDAGLCSACKRPCGDCWRIIPI